jgi:hypothetical protein
VIYKFKKGKAASIENPASIFMVSSEKSQSFKIDKKNDPKSYFYVVTSLSKSNMESQAVLFE